MLLGLAHAVGKPVVLISHKPKEIPFDVSHMRVVAYDFRMAGWEERLRADIQAAVRTTQADEGERWPPPLVGGHPPSWTASLANEIELNVKRFDEFTPRGYQLAHDKVHDRTGSEVLMDYFSCTTVYYATAEIQERIQSLAAPTSSAVDGIYEFFRTINVRATALQTAWRPWRAQQYIDAVQEFV